MPVRPKRYLFPCPLPSSTVSYLLLHALFTSISIDDNYSNRKHCRATVLQDISISALAIRHICNDGLFHYHGSHQSDILVSPLSLIRATILMSGRLLCLFENKQRDRAYGPPGTNEVALGLQVEAEDRTDGESTNFRYVY